jgi:hypothetical protein
MKGKKIAAGLLLLFVAVSVAYLIMSETGTKPDTDEILPWEIEEQAPETAAAETANPDRVIVYYFHGNTRCNTCRTIEAYTVETIRSEFAEELASGRLEWKAVNVDEDGNEQFVLDYELSTRTVVLVDMVHGEEKRWTKLERVWQLVRDKEAFVNYISENTQAYLAGRDG